jgi:CheY-like chemotaxis protein
MAQLRPILLVEDSPRDVELVLAALKKHNLANEVAVARDGVQALDFLYRRGEYESRAAGEPIVIFLDLKMPRKDGLEVLGEIKADPALRTIPIVMLTSSREEADLVRSYRLGVNAYVVKPVGFQEFMDAIKQTGMFWAVVNEPPPAAA